MRYELNFDEDKIIDIEAIGDNGVFGLKDCCKIMNEQQATINKLNKRNEYLKKELNKHIMLLNIVGERLKDD